MDKWRNFYLRQVLKERMIKAKESSVGETRSPLSTKVNQSPGHLKRTLKGRRAADCDRLRVRAGRVKIARSLGWKGVPTGKSNLIGGEGHH